jgi:hypothetical protein
MFFSKNSYIPAVAAVLAVWGAANLRAADYPMVPPPISGQFTVSPAGCTTCSGLGSTTGTCQSCQGNKGCATCGSAWFQKHEKGPYVVNLCPGACFGYFQTQWRKWDDVCPYPYQGIGVTDAPRPPAPALPGTTLPGPRPVEPKIDPKTGKPMTMNGYPQIPVPGNGY